MLLERKDSKKSHSRLRGIWWGNWYLENPRRLLQEQDAMHQKYPGFVLTAGEGGDLAWVGILRGRYEVSLTCPPNFPYSPPAAKIHKPAIVSQHMYRGSHLCLMRGDENTWQTGTSCATLVGLMAAWIFCYEQHEANCQRAPGGTPCRDPQCPDWPGPKH